VGARVAFDWRRRNFMMDNIEVVTSPCIGTKDGACAKVCPVSCFYDAGEMLVINPDECIGCGLCVPECPVAAIFPVEEVPENEQSFIARNRDFFDAKTSDDLDRLRVSA
jgi:NAD-dependent dihydropyrimidine dehydrogenase PreA subunit